MTFSLMLGPCEPWLASTLRVAAAILGLDVKHRQSGNDPTARLLGTCPFMIGSDFVAVGPIAILDLMEKQTLVDTLFPNGNRGMPLSLLTWADAASKSGDKHQEQAAGLIHRQLEDGRLFLQGARAGLADAAALGALTRHGEDSINSDCAGAAVKTWISRLEELAPKFGTQVGQVSFPLCDCPGHYPDKVAFETADQIDAAIQSHKADSVSLMVGYTKEKALPLVCDRALIKIF